MSSGGGSSSDSSSTGGYDEAGISTPTTSYESIGSTDSGGGNDYSGPTYDEAALSQPTTTAAVDPGLAGEEAVTWNVDKDGNLTVESTPDSITDYGQNLTAQIQSDLKRTGVAGTIGKAAWVLNPVGKAIATATDVGRQTLAANYLLGNIKNPFATWSSPSQDYFNKINPPVTTGDSGGDSITQHVSTPTQTISGVEMESPAQKFYNQQQQTGQLSFQSDYDAAKQKVNGLLGTPSALGLLAVNESPFYDFLKSINLNRRII